MQDIQICSSTCNMDKYVPQHATYINMFFNMQHTQICSSTYNICSSTCNIYKYVLQHATYTNTFNMQHIQICSSTCKIHKYVLKHATSTNMFFNMQHIQIFSSTSNIHKYVLQHATSTNMFLMAVYLLSCFEPLILIKIYCELLTDMFSLSLFKEQIKFRLYFLAT